MGRNEGEIFGELMSELSSSGILMVTDKALPSAAAIVAGEPIRGSWWAHPKSHEIFRMNVRVTEHSGVLVAKLVSSKNTFIYRSLWPAFYSVATSHEDWQLNKLSSLAKFFFSNVESMGQVF